MSTDTLYKVAYPQVCRNPLALALVLVLIHLMNTTIGTQHKNVEGAMQINVAGNSNSEIGSIASSGWDVTSHCSACA